MNEHDITLEPATAAQARAIPDLVFSAGPAVYRYVFGADRELFDAYVGRSWTTPDSLYSHAETTVAVDGGEVVGMEIGHGSQRTYQLKRESGVVLKLLAEGKMSEAQLEHVIEAAAKIEFQVAWIPPEAYYVDTLAVVAGLHGRGIGAGLLNAAFERARKDGYRALHLDVLSDNPAVGFYRTMGMVCMSESSVPELRLHHEVPMFFRMVKEF